MADNKNTSKYVKRDYRLLHTASDLCYFNIKVKESDLAIGVDTESYSDSLVAFCEKELFKVRGDIESYISLHPEFKSSLVPSELLPGAPAIGVEMAKAARQAGVGPMAAVAGAVAEYIGKKLNNYTREVIIENGGDIYINSSRDRKIAVFAGNSSFSNKIAIQVKPRECPLSICTSSGTVGHSLSFGKADAAVIKGRPAALADAVATMAGNLVKSKADLIKAIDYAKAIPGVSGILVIKDDNMAAWGDIEITPVARRNTNESSQ